MNEYSVPPRDFFVPIDGLPLLLVGVIVADLFPSKLVSLPIWPPPVTAQRLHHPRLETQLMIMASFQSESQVPSRNFLFTRLSNDVSGVAAIAATSDATVQPPPSSRPHFALTRPASVCA
jgi:hypothetical protein